MDSLGMNCHSNALNYFTFCGHGPELLPLYLLLYVNPDTLSNTPNTLRLAASAGTLTALTAAQIP